MIQQKNEGNVLFICFDCGFRKVLGIFEEQVTYKKCPVCGSKEFKIKNVWKENKE